MVGYSIRRPHLRGNLIVGVFLCLAIGWGHCPSAWCAPASPEATALSAVDKEEMVRQAVAQYEKGGTAMAQKKFEQAHTVFPENYAVPYYLGLVYLEQGDRQGAIAQWQLYLEMAPQSETTLNIRKNITLLLREEAKEYAKQAVSMENRLTDGPLNDNAIAVTTFSNLGSENLGPLGKGMAAMLITDLSKVSDLQVVDRIKLHALLEEMQLGTSGLVDMNTAPKVGKLLKAKHVTSGTLADLEQDSLMIASAVVDAHQSASVGAQEAVGVLKQFYEMEKQIACQIIEDLDRDCGSVPAAFNKIHTRSIPALIFYSRGLDSFDEKNYDDAREMFQKAVEEDPQFELAATALLATPTSAMASMGTSQMISSSATSGPSSSVAGTAVVGTSGSGPAISGVSAAGGVGFPPMTAIAAGVAAVGGGVALIGGGGGGDGDGGGDRPPRENTTNLTGDWRGTWEDALGISGNATFSLTQTNNTVRGTVSISGNECLTTGDISGNVTNTSADLNINSGGETISLDATVNTAAKTLSGQWHYSASGSICAGDRGTFSTSLTTGGADIHW